MKPDIDYEEMVENETRLLPPYVVVLENDDHHSAAFVMVVLCKAMGYDQSHSYQLMMEAHSSGLAVIWTGSKEVAELKLEQLLTFREGKLGPLTVYIAPVE